MGRKALVRNAADPEQVKRAKDVVKYSRDDELNDWRAVLGTPEGRRVLWRVLEQCNTNKSIFAADHGTISYRAGWQDAGHYLMAEINEAEPRAFLRMIQDANRIDANTTEPEPTKDEHE